MCERRVAKSTRKTLNDRRVAGSGSTHAEPWPRTAPARPSAAAKVGLSDELIRLAYLCQAGVLTGPEFEAAKARVLAEYRIDPAGD